MYNGQNMQNKIMISEVEDTFLKNQMLASYKRGYKAGSLVGGFTVLVVVILLLTVVL